MFDEIDEDEVDDGREPDDQDDEAIDAPCARVKPLRLVLEKDGRTIETYLICAGGSVRTDSSEAFDSPDAAKKAYERVRQQLLAEGYKEK